MLLVSFLTHVRHSTSAVPAVYKQCCFVGQSLALRGQRTVQPFTSAVLVLRLWSCFSAPASNAIYCAGRLLHTARKMLTQAGGGAGGGGIASGGGGGGGGGAGGRGLWPTYLRLLERSPVSLSLSSTYLCSEA